MAEETPEQVGDDTEGHAMKRADSPVNSRVTDTQDTDNDDVEGHRYGDDLVKPSGQADPPGYARK